MWSNAASPSGFRDPTTLFEDSNSASSSSSSSSSFSAERRNDDDFRTLQNLLRAAPGLLSALPGEQQKRRGKAERRALTAAELQAQQAQRERRFFRERGALDFQRSVVFHSDDPADDGTEDNGGGGGGRGGGGGGVRVDVDADWEQQRRGSSAAAAAFLFNDGEGQRADGRRAGVDEVDADEGGGGIACVPPDLQAWYVATNTSPSVSSRQRHDGRKKKQKKDKAQHASSLADGLPTSRRLDSPGRNSVESGAPSVFAAAAMPDGPVRSGGAGTTSVNVLWSRTAPRHQVQPPTAASRPSTSSPPLSSPPAVETTSPTTTTTTTTAAGTKKMKHKEGGDGNMVTERSDTQQTAAMAPDKLRSDVPNGKETEAEDGRGHDDEGVDDDEQEEQSQKLMSLLTPNTSSASTPTPPDAVDFSAAHAEGGRPPLRAHRYVEQPNGLFIDHARHADLLAQYALDEQLRYTQERDEARRARRWDRLLHGHRAHPQDGVQRGRGGDKATALPGANHENTSTVNANGSTSAGAGVGSHVAYHWLYDAATFRGTFASVLRYLQRVHIYFIGLAAGMSLLTLIAITVPFPELMPDATESGRPRNTTAALMLVMINQTTRTDVAMQMVDPLTRTTASVLPVLEQGHSALALFVMLLQPYHAALLLFLCIFLVVTGFSPLPWGVSERYWMAQRRMWLQQGDAEHSYRRGRRSEHSGGTSNVNSHHHGAMEMTGEMSGTALRTAPPSPRRTREYQGNYLEQSLSHAPWSRGPRPPQQFPYSKQRGRQSPLSSPSYGAAYIDPRLALSTAGFGGGGGGGYATSPSHNPYDPLAATSGYGAETMRSSLLLGASSSAGPAYRGHNNNSYYDQYQQHPYHQHHHYQYDREGVRYSGDAGTNSLLDYTADSALGLARGGGWSPTSSTNDHSLMPAAHRTAYNGAGGGYHAGVPRSPRGASSNSSRTGMDSHAAADDGAQAWSRYGPGSSSAGRLAGGALLLGIDGPQSAALQPFPPAPMLLLPVRILEGPLPADNACSRTFDFVQRRTTQLLCDALTAIRRTLCCCQAGHHHHRHHGDDAAGAAAAREQTIRKYGNSGNGDGLSERRMEKGRETAEGLSRVSSNHPALPFSLFAHVLLQPRLWCVVAALALTLVELAVVDERSVELLWAAQPDLWWRTSTQTSQVVAQGSGRGEANNPFVLPHGWMTARFSDGLGGGESSAAAADVDANNGGFGSATTVTVFDQSGRVGRILLVVYAARTAVIWVAFLLNLFF